MSFEGAHIPRLRRLGLWESLSREQQKARALGYVVLAAFVEVMALIALFACWLGSVWEISIPGHISRYSAQDAAPYTARADDVLLVFGAALALMVLVAIGAVLARRPIFSAVQILGLIALLIICRHDASWAWHVTHPLPSPPAWPTPTPTYQPCFSGSNTCN